MEVAWEKAKMLSKQSERGRDTPSTPEGFQVQKQKRPHSERASEPAVWVRAGRKRLSGLDPPRLLPPGPKASGFRPAGLGSYQRSLQTWGLQTRRTALQSGRLGADGGGDTPVTPAVSTLPAPSCPTWSLCSLLPRLWDTESPGTLARKS